MRVLNDEERADFAAFLDEQKKNVKCTVEEFFRGPTTNICIRNSLEGVKGLDSFFLRQRISYYY